VLDLIFIVGARGLDILYNFLLRPSLSVSQEALLVWFRNYILRSG